MKIISTKEAPAAIGPYSQGITTGNMVFCSGQLGVIPETGDFAGSSIEEQTTQIFKNMEAVLLAAGSSLSRVVKTTVFLSSMNDFSAMNEIYKNNFGSHKPARSTVEAAALPKNGLVEIECIALCSE